MGETAARSRIIVAMSGGVDSSVAAALLLEAGHDVQGLFMHNWDEDETGYCTSAEDYQDALRVCRHLGLPLHRANFAREYRERVFGHFLAEFRAGRTPNPDVLCNREIKFGTAFDYARRLGADFVATGHYARVTPEGVLLRGVDPTKDQSYFLHAVSREALLGTCFPIGSLTKAEVRRRALSLGLPVHAKKDSTGICFIGERPFAEFLSRYLPAQPGDIRDDSGILRGRHEGLMYYTLGQRQGLGIGGQRGDAANRDGGQPWYVVGKDLARNVLVVARGAGHPALLSRGLVTGPMHWIAGTPPGARFHCVAQVRYRQPPQRCEVVVGDEGRDASPIHVRFADLQRAVTPGQYLVLYQDDHCLGGGVIESVEAALTSAGAPAPESKVTAALANHS